MRKTLEDLYFGNIIPGDKQMAPGSKLRRAVKCAADCEKQLTKRLNETERQVLAELVSAQQDIDVITGVDNFVLGFRLGARLMLECMDEDDSRLTDRG